MDQNPQALKPSSINEDEDTDTNLVIPKELHAPKPHPEREPKEAASAPPLPTTKMPEMGILTPLMQDPSISEIMVNDLRNIVIEKSGKLQIAPLRFTSIDELNRITRNILDHTDRILTVDQPYIDTMLSDGSRVNLIGPPLTVHGPCLTIRKFPLKRLSTRDLLESGALDQKMAYFLNVCVTARLNILICGGTGAGKTTLLNILARYIPKEERIITIEDTPELIIPHINHVNLQTKPATPLSPAITIRDLVANSLRMRPDRILVGEVRKEEAFDMLIAMNTGHNGSMTTLHANSPRDGLMRLETLCMLAGSDLPILAIKQQIQSSIDLLVQIKRFKDGKRRITAITELTGMEGETLTTQDIYVFQGTFQATGFVPSFAEDL
ncbi:MAG: CpaF family protein, partial [Bdellovibrionia bacterium]